eukprot:2633522-Prymnesium_polylepis.1
MGFGVWAVLHVGPVFWLLRDRVPPPRARAERAEGLRLANAPASTCEHLSELEGLTPGLARTLFR